MTTPPLLDVNGLSVHFPLRRSFGAALRRQPRQAVRAVDGVSFSVVPGEMVALVGESGSGKSTTAQALVQMVRPAAGSIRLHGKDLGRLSAAELRRTRARLQMVYQDPYESLDPRFRVARTVAEPLVVHGVGASAAERRAMAERALERAGLAPAGQFLDRLPHELSGGQRQRVAIAAALVLEPDLLIADEPVSMLDMSVRAGVLSLFDQLRSDGLGILMITHDISTAANYADRIIVMYLGRIVEEGPAAEVVGSPAHPYTQALVAAVPRLGAGPRGDRLPAGEVPDPAAVLAGCRFHPRCSLAQETCRTHDPGLLPLTDRAGQAACPVSQRTVAAGVRQLPDRERSLDRRLPRDA